MLTLTHNSNHTHIVYFRNTIMSMLRADLGVGRKNSVGSVDIGNRKNSVGVAGRQIV